MKAPEDVPAAVNGVATELHRLLSALCGDLDIGSLPRSSDGRSQEITEVQVEEYTYVLSRVPTRLRGALRGRQREIALLVSRGFGNKTIASHLGISIGTVAVHLQRIFRKLNIASRAELARETVYLRGDSRQ